MEQGKAHWVCPKRRHLEMRLRITRNNISKGINTIEKETKTINPLQEYHFSVLKIRE